jgi:hypothetical protein
MNNRPTPVTTLMWMVLSLTAWNAIRFGAGLVQWKTLVEFAPRPGPLYILLSAAVWTLGWAALWIRLRRGQPHTRAATIWMSLAYAAWWWLDRLLLQQPRPNSLFAAIVTVFLLVFVASLLYQNNTTDYFRQREKHDPEPTHQETP